MDCEKFDQHVIDALYDELDELTYAAMKRHMESCSRCAASYAALRATREVGVLPIEEPSDDLEDRILEAAAAAQRTTPWHRKAMRALTWAGSQAMRPQLAMAAVFMLVIGSSLLLLRAKPGTQSAAPVSVRERGVPAPDGAEAQQLADEAPAAAAATAAPAAPMAEPAPVLPLPLDLPEERAAGAVRRAEAGKAKADAKEQREREQKKDADGPDKSEADAALADARAARARSGCAGAAGKLDQVAARFPSTSAGTAAMAEAAECYKSTGDMARAREIWLSLRSNDAYRDRADEELAASAPAGNAAQQMGSGARGVAGQARAAAAPAPAAAKVAAKPSAASDAPEASSRGAPAQAARQAPAGGSTGKAPAAPKKAIDSAY